MSDSLWQCAQCNRIVGNNSLALLSERCRQSECVVLPGEARGEIAIARA